MDILILDMFELGFPDTLSIAQTIGIVGTMVLTLYFSKRQIQSLSMDVETKVLNDLGEKIHRMGEMIIDRPELGKVITNIRLDRSSAELPFAFYVLYICSHAYDMRERRILNDNEWAGRFQWMRNCFQQGTIKEHWRSVESEKWFDPAFQNFINREIVTTQ
jgi:hypothetical protein